MTLSITRGCVSFSLKKKKIEQKPFKLYDIVRYCLYKIVLIINYIVYLFVYLFIYLYTLFKYCD